MNDKLNIIENILYQYEKNKLNPIDPIIFEISNALKNDRDMSEIADIIRKSATMTVELSKIANSAYYASSALEEATTVEKMLTRVGLNAIVPLLLKHSIMPKKSNLTNSFENFSAENLWIRNLVDAVASEYICDGVLANGKGDEMYVISLLKNFGIKLFNEYYPEKYHKVLLNTVNNNSALIDEEKKVFGLSHDQLGGLVMKAWNFSPKIYLVVGNHHRESFSEKEGKLEQAVRIIQLANTILPEYGSQDISLQQYSLRQFSFITQKYCSKSGMNLNESSFYALEALIKEEISSTIKDYQTKGWFLKSD